MVKFNKSFFLAIFLFCLFGFSRPDFIISNVLAKAKPKPVVVTEAPVWEQGQVTIDKLTEVISPLEKKLDELPKDALETSPEGQQRLAFKDRLALLVEWRGLLERIRDLQEQLRTNPSEIQNIIKNLETEQKRSPPTSPENPTPEGLLNAQKEFTESQTSFNNINNTIQQRRDLMATLFDRQMQAKDRLKSAQKEKDNFIELANKSKGDPRNILLMQSENAQIKARVSQQILQSLEEEQLFENETVGIRDKQLELERLRTKWHEQKVALYQEALNRLQESDVKKKEAELTLKSQEAEQAVEPSERFLKKWEAENAQLQKNIADLNKLKTDVLATITEQEKRFTADKEELKNLQDMVKESGLNERAAEILKNSFRRLKSRLEELDASIPKELQKKLADARPRQFEINGLLGNSWDLWQSELQAASQEMPTLERKVAFETKAAPLIELYRDLLSKEKQLLMEVDSADRRLSLYPEERKEILVEIETFVLSNIFWIQDAPPIYQVVSTQLIDEIFSLNKPNSILNWWLQVLSKETAERFMESLKRPVFLIVSIILLLALPLWLHLLRRRLHRDLLARHYTTKRTSSDVLVEDLLAKILDAGFTPAYLLAAAYMIGVVGLPASIGTVIEQILLHVAFFLFLWGLNQSLFNFNTRQEVANNLFRSFRLALLAYLICLLPWMIFRVAPFNFEVLPRLGYTFFEIAIAIAVYQLIRPRSALVLTLLGLNTETKEENHKKHHIQIVLGRNWRLMSGLLSIFMGTVLVLDISGYRFGSAQLARSGLLSLFTLFILIGAYNLLIVSLEKLIRTRRRSPIVTAPGVRASTSRVEFMGQIKNSIRLVFLVIGAVLFANYWGLNETIFHILSEYTLYSATGIGGEIEIVTLADFTHFLLGLLLLAWLVKHLPKLFELIVFSKVNVDSGLRYAIVTISRYLVFLIGLFVTFSFLKLDLAKVGWLVAAISVGIGFGLQEIVANFVSGIILLLERPIRVGDVISIGTYMGRVTQINIRSTTILTPDLLELLIPNRDLITKEVTNWTLGNSVVRLVVPIGVSYGSNVEQVMQLLLKIAHSQPEVLKEPAPELYFMAHGASSLDFELRVFLGDPSLRMPTLSRLNQLINKVFQENNIEIPYPQQDIHLRSGYFQSPIPHPSLEKLSVMPEGEEHDALRAKSQRQNLGG
ncbi:MAG: mechanosensitive ion channel [Magnetococcus sp. DMHC-6]